jgi:hypothetical protein
MRKAVLINCLVARRGSTCGRASDAHTTIGGDFHQAAARRELRYGVLESLRARIDLLSLVASRSTIRQ